ncbi:hypothetical protein SLS64_005982 [Diaporthe eres]
MGGSEKVKVLLILFDDFNTIDMNGPYDILTKSGQSEHLFVEVAAEKEITKSIEGVLVEVGGGSDAVNAQAAKLDSAFMRLIAAFANTVGKVGDDRRVLLSICTGAAFPANLGIFNDRYCTTHWAFYGQVTVDLQCAAVRTQGKAGTVVPARFVDSGLNAAGVRVISSGGITCSLDASLHVVKLMVSEEESIATATLLDYSWRKTEAVRAHFEKIAGALPAVESIMALAGVPGLSIGIIDGTSNTTKTYHLGYRDVENRLAPNDHTRYNINSLTKGIVSALAGAEVLRSQGTERLSWHQPIRAWLPELAGLSSDLRVESTLVDLLSHRVGVTGINDLWFGADNEIYLPRSEAVRTFASLKMAEPFRTSFDHSNWNYELVGQVLERATGETISDMFEKRLFTPLGMKRTSTSWSESDENQAKSYGVLPDLSPVEVARPFSGNDTIMTAVGGVKSTLHDMLIFYKAFMEEVNVHYASLYDSIGSYPFKYCRMITTNHASLPGPSLREQGYGMGWVRAELPGPLGRISANWPSGGIIVGRGSPSHLVLYNQGCMPGSTSGVWLMPELKAGVVVLQNSMASIDTADFIGQLLLETLLQPPQPNDYVDISRQFNVGPRRYIDGLKAELHLFRVPGTHARPLSSYEGRFWNELHNFFIDIAVSDTGPLQMKWQGLDSQSYELHHYHYDVFSWLMSPEEMVKRARIIQFHPAEYYLLEFGSDNNGPFS